MFKKFNLLERVVGLLRDDNKYSKVVAIVLNMVVEPLKKWFTNLMNNCFRPRKPNDSNVFNGRNTKDTHQKKIITEKKKESSLSLFGKTVFNRSYSKQTTELSNVDKARLSDNPPTVAQNRNKGDKANEKNRKKTPPKKKEKSSKKSASRKRRNHKNSRKKQ